MSDIIEICQFTVQLIGLSQKALFSKTIFAMLNLAGAKKFSSGLQSSQRRSLRR
jgi:hypothetical protein